MPNWIGDIVLATPTLRALRISLPRASISVAVRPYASELAQCLPDVDHVLQIDPREGLRKAARALRSNAFDTAILLPNSLRSALICRLAGIPRRIGYAMDARRLFLTHTLSPPRRIWPAPPETTAADLPDRRPRPRPFSRTRWAIASARDSYLRLAALLGAVLPTGDDGLPRLSPGPDALEQAQAFLTRAGVLGPFVILNPGGAFGSAKLWPPQRFADLANSLASRAMACIVSVSPSEAPLAEAICARAPAARPLDPPARRISTVLGLVQRCSALVTNDTGPRHFAVALGRPLVTLFGPTHQGWTAVGYPNEVCLQLDLPCGPCQQKQCPLGTQACMTGLGTEAVLAALERLLPGQMG